MEPPAGPALRRAADLALEHLATAGERRAGPLRNAVELEALIHQWLPYEGADPVEVVEELAAVAADGLVGTAGPRYFGFVTGGALPAALAADWLAAAWDQNAFSAVSSPAAAAVESVAAGWLLHVLGLPPTATVGLTTGAQMANVTGLAAGRHRVLADVGWDVAARGLNGAPPVLVVAGAEAHVTVERALRLLGLGAPTRVAADDQGRMEPAALRAALAGHDGPAIVCAQAGNVNTGAIDPLAEIVEAARDRGAWVHVDGAFGLWAAASRRLRHLVDGAAGANSWATDGHKWLNVPYDCGVAAVADVEAHRAATGMTAAYLVQAGGRSNSDWVPEASRRARGFTVYAALRQLGIGGVGELVDRCCALAARMAEQVAEEPAVAVLNDVVLNQVLVRVADDDAATDAAITAIQREGTCWLGGTRWQGKAAMRISISSHATTEEDVDRSAAVIRAAARDAAQNA